MSPLPTFQNYTQDRQYIRNVSPKTLAWFTDAWKAFGPFVEPALNDGTLQSGLLAGIVKLKEKGVKPVSINSYLTCIRAYVNWLWKEGHLKDKPKVQLLKCEKKVIATFSAAQVQALLSHKPKGRNEARAHIVACVMLDSGLRLAEALTLTRQAVDLDNLCLKVKGKGSKERLVPMSLELRKRLFRWQLKHQGELLFSTRTGTRVTNRNFQRDFKVLCARIGIAGVRCSPHTLRHSFAVGYLRRGGNIFYLSRILGHTSVRTTERYLQSLNLDDLKAVHNGLSLLSP